MIKVKEFQPLVILGMMAIVGVATASVSMIALFMGLGIFAYGLYKTVRTRNAYGSAHLFAALIVGAEVYFRMSYAGLPWEFGKISVGVLLITGMLVERQRRPKPIIFLLYTILLLPATFVPDWRDMEEFKKEIMFNFSGHITLILAVFYFYKRRFDRDAFIKLGQWFIYGVILMSVMILLKSPEYSTIRYGGGSNFDASGGFGPNQVAALFGLGAFILGLFLLLNIRLFRYKLFEIALLALFVWQGFFTLSRGGLMGAGIALILGVLILYILNPQQVVRLLKISPLKIIFIGIVILFAFIQADQMSSGAISKRYFNVNEYGRQIKKDYSTKRVGIVEADLKTFSQNWETGAGIGRSNTGRLQETGIGAAHVEFSRMLADHGILGLLALLILFLYPVIILFRHKEGENRFILITFTALALLTMSHNAMRLAMPSFLYAIGFVITYGLIAARHEGEAEGNL